MIHDLEYAIDVLATAHIPLAVGSDRRAVINVLYELIEDGPEDDEGRAAAEIVLADEDGIGRLVGALTPDLWRMS